MFNFTKGRYLDNGYEFLKIYEIVACPEIIIAYFLTTF